MSFVVKYIHINAATVASSAHKMSSTTNNYTVQVVRSRGVVLYTRASKCHMSAICWIITTLQHLFQPSVWINSKGIVDVFVFLHRLLNLHPQGQ